MGIELKRSNGYIHSNLRQWSVKSDIREGITYMIRKLIEEWKWEIGTNSKYSKNEVPCIPALK